MSGPNRVGVYGDGLDPKESVTLGQVALGLAKGMEPMRKILATLRARGLNDEADKLLVTSITALAQGLGGVASVVVELEDGRRFQISSVTGGDG